MMGVKSYVSIPLWFLRNKYLSAISEALETRFHTTMVLTQPGAKFKNHRDPVLFPYHYGSYATLGRRYRSSKNRLVSIPLWFSRNTTLLLLPPTYSKTFPYHYGSHATSNCLHLHRNTASFHTTMVLTQLTTNQITECFIPVSIPLWFLRNHIWRHKIRSSSVVSIPLWFLRNRTVSPTYK